MLLRDVHIFVPEFARVLRLELAIPMVVHIKSDLRPAKSSVLSRIRGPADYLFGI